MPVLPRVRPSAAERRPPQTPAAGAQAGHRRRQTRRRPPKVCLSKTEVSHSFLFSRMQLLGILILVLINLYWSHIES